MLCETNSLLVRTKSKGCKYITFVTGENILLSDR